MDVPIIYTKGFVKEPEKVFDRLWNELDWLDVAGPRIEYYTNDHPVPYTYGSGNGVRTYMPQPMHPIIQSLRDELHSLTGFDFNACFLNGYRTGKDQLGWHSDDSPELDDKAPIAIISIGLSKKSEREIMWRPKLNLLIDKSEALEVQRASVSKTLLENGSLCLMLPGMQDTHDHRIPKSSIVDSDPRISFTFRNYIYG